MSLPAVLWRAWLLAALAAWCCLGASPALAAPRGLPASEGIPNFGKVNASLYRGAQPDEAALASLQRLGVKSIINLRQPGDLRPFEAAAAQARGITYTNVPLSGIRTPTRQQMQHLLNLIGSLPAPVFVHCEFGCDRTGTVIACYRISHDHWSGTAALAEAERYGLSKLERGMKHFILEFGKENRAR